MRDKRITIYIILLLCLFICLCLVGAWLDPFGSQAAGQVSGGGLWIPGRLA